MVELRVREMEGTGRKPEEASVKCLLIRPGDGEGAQRLEEVCATGVHLVGVASDLEGARQVLSQEHPQVILLGLDGAPEEILKIAEGLSRRQVTLLGLAEGAHLRNAKLLLAGMRAGIREFLPLPLDPEALAESVKRWALERGEEGPALRRRTGKVVAIFGAAGGCGVTTMVVNLGALLIREFGRRVVLLDLNLQWGSLGLSLDIGPGPTLADAAAAALEEDWQALSSMAFHHRSGVYVLPEPRDLLEANRVTPEGVGSLLRGLAGLYDFVIADCPAVLNPHTLRALDEAQRVLLLTTPTVPALRNTVRRLDVFHQLGVAKEKVEVILAEVSPVVEIPPNQRQEVLGREVKVTLPHDPKAVVGALNRGQLILDRAPKSLYILRLKGLAGSLAERRAGREEDRREPALAEGRAR